MRNFAIVLAAVEMLFAIFTAAPARAQDHAHAWVSNGGIDNADCGTTSSPCRTITQAVSFVTVSEVSCLDSGDFGQFTITASIVIDCNGTVATTASNDNSEGCPTGITINAPGAVVILRNLDVTAIIPGAPCLTSGILDPGGGDGPYRELHHL